MEDHSALQSFHLFKVYDKVMLCSKASALSKDEASSPEMLLLASLERLPAICAFKSMPTKVLNFNYFKNVVYKNVIVVDFAMHKPSIICYTSSFRGIHWSTYIYCISV